MTGAFERLCSFENLLDAFTKAARGKRTRASVAAFDYELADRLLELKRQLESAEYRPGAYVHFFIQELIECIILRLADRSCGMLFFKITRLIKGKSGNFCNSAYKMIRANRKCAYLLKSSLFQKKELGIFSSYINKEGIAQ